MRNYVSKRGHQILCDVRVGDPPSVTGGVEPPVKLLACVPSEECDCPEEIWMIDNIEVLIHMEDSCEGHIILYLGDEEREWFVPVHDMMHLRGQMFKKISGFFAGVK